ncbi:hypothetical protein IAG44_10490 [Streptomyces roseirectus]|uniref:PH domain-containing protein n=1 Tax=Streptomyces roseirectus TaxID=2768066 RepID=A0A7H0IAL5_9ACTN|nr:hypothetical protein [Streptomyces roseirectus]QNP69831.1 hypothetical protein IAG44_10490 [Streptomyces roseirectus]
MPLPFLTADRTFESVDPEDGEALPFAGREQWRRPYRPGPWRVGVAAVWLLVASFVLFAAVLIALTGSVSEAGAVFAVAGVVIGCALRLLRVGVWVSARGLRHVGFFVTRTVAWSDVSGVRTVQQPVRWLGLPRTVQGQALVLARRGAEGVAVLLTTHNADFLARGEAFDRAADTVEAWAAESRGVTAS